MIRPSHNLRTWRAAAPAALLATLAVLSCWSPICRATGIGSGGDVEVQLQLSPEDLRGSPPGSRLPVISRLVILPDETAVQNIRLRHVVWDTLARGDGLILPDPAHAPYAVTAEGIPGIADPDSMVTVVRDGYLRGYHLAQLLIRPLRHMEDEERILLARRIHVAIELRTLSAEESSSIVRIRRPGLGDEVTWILNTVVNPHEFDLFYPHAGMAKGAPVQHEESTPYGGFRPTKWPSLQGPPVEQVIITDDRSLAGNPIGDMTGVFNAYAQWKTNRGVPTVVARVSEIDLHYPGYDQVERIKAYLEAAVRDWGVKWILLGGDVQVVPTRRLGGEDGGGHLRPDPPADVYYVRFGEDWNADGDPYVWDGIPDLGPLGPHFNQAWIGRLPCRDALEAQVMIEKIRSYLGDFDPHPSTDYFESLLLATGPVNSMDPHSTGYASGEKVLVPFREVAWSDTVRLYGDVDLHSELCNGNPEPCYEELFSYLDSLDVTPWEGNALYDHLASGYHVVYHLEHSIRDFLGTPSVSSAPPFPEGCTDPNWKRRCERDLRSQWGSIRNLTREQAFELPNGPRYSIVISGGSFTNEFDMDTVGEAFLRAPDGGAVAYIGKVLSHGGYGTNIARGIFEKVLHQDMHSIGQALSFTIAEGATSTRFALLRAYQFPFFGDPEMAVWSKVPSSFRISVEPDTVEGLGVRDIVIVARSGITGARVPDARVCLRQGDAAYGVRETDHDGRVEFRGFPVLSQEPVFVSVTAPDFYPLHSELAVRPSSPHLAYESHVVDDTPPDGDGDGELEEGEEVRLSVMARNFGNAPARDPRTSLRVTAPVRLDLRINGEEATGSVVIGSSSSHPPGAIFTIPPAGHGFRTEGKPISPATTGYSLWREQDGLYVLEASTRPESTDNFEGTLVTSGSFSDVTFVGEGDDQLFWEGDSIRFLFSGDETPDELRFRAEAPEWIQLEALDDSSSAHPEVEPGGMTSSSWRLRLDQGAPDGFTMPLTLSATQDDSIRSYSDFSITWKAPEPHLLYVEQSASLDGLVLRPVIRNAGEGRWRSLRLVLHKLEGWPEVLDSVSILPALEPGETHVAQDSMVLETYGTDDIRFEIRAGIDAYSTILGACDASTVTLPAPQNLRVDSHGRGFVLRWDPVPDVERYAVHLLPPEGPSVFLGFAQGASRFEVTHIDGTEDHTVQVRACRDCRCGEPATSEPDRIWMSEAESWPKRVPGGITTAPKVVPSPALGGRGAVFVAGRRIYAWLDDGSPLRSGEEFADGLFYDPQLPALPRSHFTESLAVFRFEKTVGSPSETGWALAGNVPGVGLIVIRLVPEADGVHWRPEPYWSQPISSALSAPVVWPLLDEEQSYTPQLFLPANSNILHAWTHDGQPLLTQFEDGAFGEIPDGSHANYRSLAVAEASEVFRHNVIQSTRSGHLLCWSLPEDLDTPALLNPLWDLDLEEWNFGVARYSLSSPAVGDVDGDGFEEIIVTNQTGPPDDPSRPGRVWIVNAMTGEIEAFAESWDWSFRSPSSDNPAPCPALSDLDQSPGLEIVLAGQAVDDNRYPARHRVHVLSLRNDGIVDLTCDDEPVLPSRNSGNIDAAIIWQSPALFDVDGDDAVEILAPSASGNLFLWETHGPLQQCRGERGWPMSFGDLVMTPTLEDLDGNGTYEMVVSAGDGFVHLFELPECDTPSPWNQYGADLGNTRRVPAIFGFRGPSIALRGTPRNGFLSVSPIPFRPRQSIRFALSDPGGARLDVIDVAGRRVRTLLHRDYQRGVHEAAWDGRDERGHSLASGVYFYRLSLAGRTEVRRTLMIR